MAEKKNPTSVLHSFRPRGLPPQKMEIDKVDVGERGLVALKNIRKGDKLLFVPPLLAGCAPYNDLQTCDNDDFLEVVNMDDVGLTFEKSEELLSPMLNVIQDNFK
ncbi:hypothetical protein AAC387_Pa02g3554 [Persea americana]